MRIQIIPDTIILYLMYKIFKTKKLLIYLYAFDILLKAPLLHKHRVFSCASNAACMCAYDIRENIAHKFLYNLTENKIKIHKYPCNLLLLSLFLFFFFTNALIIITRRSHTCIHIGVCIYDEAQLFSEQ